MRNQREDITIDPTISQENIVSNLMPIDLTTQMKQIFLKNKLPKLNKKKQKI